MRTNIHYMAEVLGHYTITSTGNLITLHSKYIDVIISGGGGGGGAT